MKKSKWKKNRERERQREKDRERKKEREGGRKGEGEEGRGEEGERERLVFKLMIYDLCFMLCFVFYLCLRLYFTI